jgi:hypothetical protein
MAGRICFRHGLGWKALYTSSVTFAFVGFDAAAVEHCWKKATQDKNRVQKVLEDANVKIGQRGNGCFLECRDRQCWKRCWKIE